MTKVRAASQISLHKPTFTPGYLFLFPLCLWGERWLSWFSCLRFYIEDRSPFFCGFESSMCYFKKSKQYKNIKK